MKINEIGYASGIQSLASQLTIDNSTHIGNVDNQQVFQTDLNNGMCYFLYNANNQTYLSYVASNNQVVDGYHPLNQIENTSNIPGSVSTLLYFLINNKGIKFIISAGEPLTDKGLAWLIKAIQSDRGLFTIKNQNGEPVDLKALEAEWEASRTDSSYQGKISVVIESTGKESYNNIFKSNDGLLKTPYRILEDKSLD
jgi:hypothetical protein